MAAAVAVGLHTMNEGLDLLSGGNDLIIRILGIHTYMCASLFAYAHYTMAERRGNQPVGAVCCVFRTAARPNIDIITAGLYISGSEPTRAPTRKRMK